MRIIADDAKIKIVATPNYYFTGDRCFYEVTAKAAPSFSITLTIGGVEYKYDAFARFLKIDITDIMRIQPSGKITINIKYQLQGDSATYRSDSIVKGEGKTFPDRTHASITHIELPNFKTPVDVFVLGDAEVNNGSTFKRKPEMGIMELPALNKRNYQITINYKNSYLVGGIESSNITTKSIIDVSVKCNGDGDVVLKYKDCDGCRRYAVAKIISSTSTSNGIEYNSDINEISHIKMRYITEGNKTMKVALSHIPKGQRIEDILFSREVYVGSVDDTFNIPCIITSNNITIAGNKTNVFLNIKTIEI